MTKLLKRGGIYVLTHRESGKRYVGKDVRLGKRAKKHLSLKEPDCPVIHNAIKKHGKKAFGVQLIPYPNISHEALCEVEKWKIRQLRSHRSQGGYNLTFDSGGLDSETARENARKRVQDGTHNFLGSENNLKRIADGTHPSLDSEFRQKITETLQKANRKRLEDGTHNFLDGEFQRENNLKRVTEGTHHFLGDNNPSHKRVTDGTHNFLDSGFQSEVQQKRIADGTHHFLGGEIQRRNSRKRLEDGTHNFLDPQVSRKGQYANRIKRKNQRRELYRIYAALLTAKSVCEERIYRKRIREGFFDKDIPDMSKSEQLDLF